MPSSLRERVTWALVSCRRVATVVASRSGTATQVTSYVVPGTMATDRSGTCAPPDDAFSASSTPASSATVRRTPLPSGSASAGGVQRYRSPFGLPASSVRYVTPVSGSMTSASCAYRPIALIGLGSRLAAMSYGSTSKT
jgi:hypothetical protein